MTERGTAWLELKLPAACDAGWTLEFFRPRAIRGVEQITGNTYARSFVSAGGAGIVEASVGRKAIGVELDAGRIADRLLQLEGDLRAAEPKKPEK